MSTLLLYLGMLGIATTLTLVLFFGFIKIKLI
uniref:Cytochrome b6-f complex subunit 6 n=1 Tax=Pseudocodium devriesii TaxID=453070 RepID=A0A386B154_9CHLO|nr:cytochrome b6-f complex subunit 6 [Pseudocodium devriesii]AYC65432.1 cytochrome b6-f complex subunit 6 [Pseudocodium devriesii]